MSVKVDPRIKRTRQLLQKALNELLAEKEFHSISVQDITTRAEVNRATFYAHFEDKYALLNHNVREQFLHVLGKHASNWDEFTPTCMRTLVIAVYEYLAQFTGHCTGHGPISHDDKLFVLSEVQKQVAAILERWLQPLDDPRVPSPASVAMVASWSIFGTSFQWTRNDRFLTSTEAADRILMLIMPGLKAYLPKCQTSNTTTHVCQASDLTAEAR